MALEVVAALKGPVTRCAHVGPLVAARALVLSQAAQGVKGRGGAECAAEQARSVDAVAMASELQNAVKDFNMLQT